MKTRKPVKKDKIPDDNRRKEHRKEHSWDEFFESLCMFPDDFLIDRNQPIELDKRDPLFD